jgi:hypothetical protein
MTHTRIVETGHDQVDVELPPLAPSLPFGLAVELLAASGAPASGVLGAKICQA